MAVLSVAQVRDLFGEFKYSFIGTGGAIDIDDQWERENIVTVFVPQLRGVKSYAGTCNGNVRWHKLASVQLQRAFQEVETEGLLKDVLFWGGSYVPRVMRGSKKNLSRHSWGIAFDINVDQNGFGVVPARPGMLGSVHRLVPIFKTHGFCWGGDWSHHDGMHFEIDRIISFEEKSDAILVVNDDFDNIIPVTITNGVSMASAKALNKLIGVDVEAEKLIPVSWFLTTHGYHVTWNAEQKKVYAYKN